MLFIFDFDYTLVDTSKGIIKSFNYAFQNTIGKTFSDGLISNTIGWGLKEAFYELSGNDSEEDYKVFYKYFMECSSKCMTEEAKVFTDTLYVLKKLKEEQHKIAILSAKDTYTINKIAEKFQFKEYIDRIVGEDTVKNTKPNTEGVENIIKHFPTYNKDSICMVGDSIVDYNTAKNIGLKFIAVTTGKTTAEQFTDAGATLITKNLVETYELYKEMSSAKLFLSWSETMSKKVAEQFADLLCKVFGPSFKNKIFLSTKIEAGINWYNNINNNLENSSYGVCFVTYHNVKSVWMNYEVGGLSIGKTKNLTALLLNDNISLQNLPFGHRQTCQLTSDSVLTLVNNIAKTFRLKDVQNSDQALELIDEFIIKSKEITSKYWLDLHYLHDKSRQEEVATLLGLLNGYLSSNFVKSDFKLYINIQLCDFDNNKRKIMYEYPKNTQENKLYDLYFGDMGSLINTYSTTKQNLMNASQFKFIPLNYLDWLKQPEEYRQVVSPNLRFIAGFPIMFEGKIIGVMEIHFYSKEKNKSPFPQKFINILNSTTVTQACESYAILLSNILCK